MIMAKCKDISGLKFGRLTVVSRAGTQGHNPVWNVICECGTRRVVQAGHLKNGTTTSCGCYQKENMSKVATKHKLSEHPLYSVWAGMKSRCDNPKWKDFEHYGARGISYSSSWKIFLNFYKDMHEGYVKGLELDRIDNDRDYSKENCRWVTGKQNKNNKRNNHLIVFREVTRTISQWADYYKQNYDAFYSKLKTSKFDLGVTLSKLGLEA